MAGNTATEVMGAANTAPETKIAPEPERTTQIINTQEAGGTPGDRFKTGRTGGGTTAAMAGAQVTAIKTPEEAETAAWNPEDG